MRQFGDVALAGMRREPWLAEYQRRHIATGDDPADAQMVRLGGAGRQRDEGESERRRDPKQIHPPVP
jgi:hypothetical protein